jgi:hypothetical protein
MSFLSCICLHPHGPQAKRNAKEVIRTTAKIAKPYIYESQKLLPRTLSYAFTEVLDNSPDITEG